MELHFTDDTEFALSEAVDIQDVHLEDLTWVAEVDHGSEGNVERIEIDLKALVRSQTLYGAMEKQQYTWRKKARGYLDD